MDHHLFVNSMQLSHHISSAVRLTRSSGFYYVTSI